MISTSRQTKHDRSSQPRSEDKWAACKASDHVPNERTAAAIREIRNGGGKKFKNREEYFEWLNS